jgi:SAM-dependent methyltransferase
MSIFTLLTEPELRELDMDSPLRIVLHRRILSRKPMIRGVFADFYRLCRALDERFFQEARGLRVELGAGVSIVKDFYPDVMVTDIVPADHLDAVVDAQETHFENGSVRAFYGLNCFHHFPDPERFFRELTRVVQPGGGCILIEPYHGPVASIIYKRLFTSEIFDKTCPGWERDCASHGAMVGANQAASYIVFVRDRARLASLFPELEVAYQRPLKNYLRYLLSGGLNFRPVVPAFLDRFLAVVETVLEPLARLLALHQVVVVRRLSDGGADSLLAAPRGESGHESFLR